MHTLRRSYLVRSGTLASLLSGLLAACGGSGGTATSGGTTTGGASCAPQSLAGLVNFSQELAPHAGNVVSASFAVQPFSGSVDFGCNPACAFHPSGDGGSSFDAGAFMDIGTVIVTDLTSKATEALTENSSIYFAESFTWAAGDMLEVGGGSDSFPSFSIPIGSPVAIAVTSPSQIAAGGTVMASQAAGLTVTWTPSTRPATFVSVGILSPAGEIDCYPPDSAGTVTIPPSVLSSIPAGSYPAGLSVGRWVTLVGAANTMNIGVQAEAYLSAAIQVGP